MGVRQHYYPQMLLLGWKIEGTKSVWKYTVDKAKPHPVRIRDIFMEDTLYRVNGLDGIEKRLHLLESAFGPIKKKIYENDELVREDILWIKIFFSFLFSREIINKEADWDFIETHFEDISDNPFANTLIIRANCFSEYFKNFHVEIRNIPDDNFLSFILCDHPSFCHKAGNGKWIFTCPIGPKHIIIFIPTDEERISYSYSNQVEEKEVNLINKMALQNLSKFFIYDRDDPRIYDLLV